jgi:hypothetical protein
MDFNTIAAICSIVGAFLSGLAAYQAQRASKAASAARDAALVHSLADELQLACTRGEQLVDFLHQCRYKEASLRIDELTWSLSELPYRRSPYLQTADYDKLLTSRVQLQTIGDAIRATTDGLESRQIMTVAREVTISLREILGVVRSNIERGEPR